MKTIVKIIQSNWHPRAPKSWMVKLWQGCSPKMRTEIIPFKKCRTAVYRKTTKSASSFYERPLSLRILISPSLLWDYTCGEPLSRWMAVASRLVLGTFAIVRLLQWPAVIVVYQAELNPSHGTNSSFVNVHASPRGIFWIISTNVTSKDIQLS